MRDLFADAAEREALVGEAAYRRGLSPVVVEKDLWVCWTLARLHDIPGVSRFTFKGGTSLSKVHRLIDRFSEDIDLTFSRDGWGFDSERDPLHPGISGNRQRKLVEEISARAASMVRDVVVPGLQAACSERLGEGAWTVEVDEAVADLQTVVFSYPSAEGSGGYLRPSVRMEFGARGDPWPTSPHVVRPIVEEELPGEAASAVVEVETLAVERTFWEKATLLHALHHRTLGQPGHGAARQSRHAYDLHRMWGPLRGRLLAHPALLDAVVANKMVFVRQPSANYPLVLERTLSASPHPVLEEQLRADFVAMADMFFPGTPVPTFEEMMVTLREIDAAVAGWR